MWTCVCLKKAKVWRMQNAVSKGMLIMSQVWRGRTLCIVHQVCRTALAIFMCIFLNIFICWNQQAHSAPPTSDIFMHFQFITVSASWDLVWLCHNGTNIQCVLRTGAHLFPVVRVWKFPLHTPALSQCCCSTAGQDTRSFPSPPKQGGGTSSLLPSLLPSSHHRDTMGSVSSAQAFSLYRLGERLRIPVMPWRLQMITLSTGILQMCPVLQV